MQDLSVGSHDMKRRPLYGYDYILIIVVDYLNRRTGIARKGTSPYQRNCKYYSK